MYQTPIVFSQVVEPTSASPKLHFAEWIELAGAAVGRSPQCSLIV